MQLFIAPEHPDSAPVGIVSATDADGDALTYSLASGGDNALFTIDATGLIAVAPGTVLADEGRDLFTLTAQVSDGEDGNGDVESTPAIDDTIVATVTLADISEHRVPLAPSASDPLERQGFVRVVNHSGQAGTVGDGKGKWRLRVTADRPLRVMSLLSTPTGHLTNLSAAPGRPRLRVPAPPG